MSGRPWLLRQAGPPARVVFWWLLRTRGTDVTESSSGRSCMVLAAHPDDETLGCAVTIMRRRDRGTPVVLVVATDGSRSTPSSTVASAELAAIRADEAAEAGRLMGLEPANIVHLGFDDSFLAREEAALGDRLVELLRAHGPEEVLVTAATDPHPDHAALGRAARRAVAAAGMTSTRILEYPIWQWRHPGSWLARGAGGARWSAVQALGRLRPELVCSAGFVERKRAALSAHASQLGSLTGESDWWSLDRRFVANFFRSHELFLPVRED